MSSYCSLVAQTVKDLSVIQEMGSVPGSGCYPRREWLPIPLFLAVELYGQRSLVGVGHDSVTDTFTAYL